MQKQLSDKSAMRRALALAVRGAGRTKPNPLVGALVVADGKIVGRGWHKQAGCLHAEIEALNQAGDRARDATLYVTLEPCNHHGKTPPCAEAVLSAGIRRVVCAMRDTNPKVEGGGLEFLQKAGIEVTEGVLEEEARTINRAWLYSVEKDRPFVLLKLAHTIDGAIAGKDGARRQISSNASLAHAQRLRAYFDAIMVGVGTVMRDDPLLTNRSAGGAQLLKVVIDSKLRTLPSAKIFETGSVQIFCSASVDSGRQAALEERGAKIVSCVGNDGQVDLAAVIAHLHREGIQALLCEGGAKIAASMLRANLVDRFLSYESPRVIEGGLRVDFAAQLLNFEQVWEKRKGGDKVRLYAAKLIR